MDRFKKGDTIKTCSGYKVHVAGQYGRWAFGRNATYGAVVVNVEMMCMYSGYRDVKQADAEAITNAQRDGARARAAAKV